ncbi:predicted protein [Streptomyces sp. C]|nr:predicted protein [Streptomyces sp. C]
MLEEVAAVVLGDGERGRQVRGRGEEAGVVAAYGGPHREERDGERPGGKARVSAARVSAARVSTARPSQLPLDAYEKRITLARMSGGRPGTRRLGG